MEALQQVLRMCDVDGKLLNGIKIIYVNALSFVRIKCGENDCLKISRWMRQGCIMTPWLCNIYMDAVMEMKMGMGRKGMRFQE